MKSVFLWMMLFCTTAMISTSCNPENNSNVNPETENGTMAMGSKTIKVTTAKTVNYGQKNAIVLAAEAMTEADNEGIAILFNGNITPGEYTLGATKDAQPQVIALKDFNMGELPFVINAETLYYGDVYYWVSGALSITEHNGTYTIVLSGCTATNNANTNLTLAVNFSGILDPYVIDTENKFTIGNITSPIGLAGVTTLNGMSTLGLNIQSMLFMSADHKRSFIISYLGDATLDGEHQLGYLFTPYLPTLPCVHVALDSDFWTMQPQTGYVAKSGTLKVVTNEDGTKTVTMRNLKLKNVEHESEFFFPILDAELQDHGYMYEIGR